MEANASLFVNVWPWKRSLWKSRSHFWMVTQSTGSQKLLCVSMHETHQPVKNDMASIDVFSYPDNNNTGTKDITVLKNLSQHLSCETSCYTAGFARVKVTKLSMLMLPLLQLPRSWSKGRQDPCHVDMWSMRTKYTNHTLYRSKVIDKVTVYGQT